MTARRSLHAAILRVIANKARNTRRMQPRVIVSLSINGIETRVGAETGEYREVRFVG